MLRGEEAWAEARFAESKWNEEDPECAECGDAIDEDGTCVACGAEYMTDAARRQRNEEDRAEYLAQLKSDGEEF